MCGLYSKQFLLIHKMTAAAPKIGDNLKISIKSYELTQIQGGVARVHYY